MTAPNCLVCSKHGIQWCPFHGPFANDPGARAMVAAHLAAMLQHDQIVVERARLLRETGKDIHPTNSGTSGMQILNATNTEGNRASVLQTNYDARPYEGCEGLALLHWRVRDQEVAAPNTRHNSKIMLDIVVGTGIAEIHYPMVDATKGGRLSIPGAGAITVTAFVAAANSNALVLHAAVTVQAAISWGGGSRVPAFQTLPAITLAPNVASAFVAIPDQAHIAMATTTAPGRAAALQVDFATDAFAADIRYSELAPNLNSTPIHSGVEFIRYTGDIAQDVTPLFETN